MRYLIILILLLKTSLIFCQDNTDLYLIFKKKKNKVYINKTKSLNNLNIYSYVTKNIRDQKDILHFSSLTITEEEKYSKLNGKYRVKATQDTLNIKELKSYNLKSYKWLLGKMKKKNNFYEIEDSYKKIFIVEIDSINNKAILTEVQHVEIIP